MRTDAAAAERLASFRERARGLARRDALDTALVAVVTELGRSGVEALVLKGPVLARTLYTAEEIRGYTDIDLLVGPEDLPETRRVLAAMGFRHGSRRGIEDVAGVVNAESWLRLADPAEKPVPIDLHWRLAGCTAPLDVAWAALRPHRAKVEIAGVAVPTLDRAGLALHLATHAAQHGPQGLKAIGDLARGVERWPAETWRSAATLADETGALPAFAAGLRLTPAGASLARELELPQAEEIMWEIRHRKLRPRGTFHLRAWGEAKGLRERAGILRRALLPSPDWVRAEYPGAGRSTGWLVLAYVRHLARTPAWGFGAWRFRRRARRARN